MPYIGWPVTAYWSRSTLSVLWGLHGKDLIDLVWFSMWVVGSVCLLHDRFFSRIARKQQGEKTTV